MASEVVLALPHRLRVMRMYRTGLKELINWSSNRHEWYPRVGATDLQEQPGLDVNAAFLVLNLVEPQWRGQLLCLSPGRGTCCVS